MRIGVIIPVRRPAPFLDEALRSALAQDPPPDGHVVVEDREGRGPAPARDEGLAQIEDCDWIALLDADDTWEPGKLAAQRAALAAHPEAVMCVGHAIVVDAEGRETGERLPQLRAGLHPAEELAPLMYEQNRIATSSVVVRREALVEAGGFAGPARLASDWDLWLRLLARGGALVCEPAALIRYRRHPAAVTADVAALAESMIAVRATHRRLVDEATARRLESRDLVLLARGRIRARRYAEAADALERARSLAPVTARERLLQMAIRLPGPRALLGRRRPYRS